MNNECKEYLDAIQAEIDCLESKPLSKEGGDRLEYLLATQYRIKDGQLALAVWKGKKDIGRAEEFIYCNHGSLVSNCITNKH